MNAHQPTDTAQSTALKIKTALFKDCSGSEIPFKPCIISVFRVDEDGGMYFNVRKPYADLTGFPRKFAARLQFNHKEANEYMILEGIAELMEHEDNDRERESPLVLVKLTTTHAHIFSASQKKTAYWRLITDQVARWILPIRFRKPAGIQFDMIK